MKSLILFTALVTAGVLAGVPASATTSAVATTSTAVDVDQIDELNLGAFGWNAHGSDRTWNANAEYIDVKNVTDGPVNVKGLVVEDSWRHAQPAGTTSPCNRFEVSGVPQTNGTTAETLPAGHTLRVYVGSGTPRVFWSGEFHAVYMNSPAKCGYNSHIFNNGPRADKRAPWDTVYVTTSAGKFASKSYNYSFGYVAK
jgi:hypothetical protein